MSLVTLAARLGLGEGAVAVARAEAIASRMIAEGRVAGSIDQVDAMIDFVEAPRAGGGGAASGGHGILGLGRVDSGASQGVDAAGAAMLQDDVGFSSGVDDATWVDGNGSLAVPPSVAALVAWDASIKRACLGVKGAVDAVGALHPQFIPA